MFIAFVIRGQVLSLWRGTDTHRPRTAMRSRYRDTSAASQVYFSLTSQSQSWNGYGNTGFLEKGATNIGD